jgi:hypothetical protein
MTVAILLENTIRCAALTLKVDLDADAIPATTQGCPLIPMRHLRSTLLIDLLSNVMKSAGEKPVPIAELYGRVLEGFGPENCKPYVNCPHYSTPHAEYKHVTRLALWDGQRRGLFQRAGRGAWKLA